MLWVLAMLLGTAIQAQAQLSIQPAATDPVAGWQRMESSDGAQTIWVAPTPALTASDIEAAQSETDTDGRAVVAIQFTTAGSDKMGVLSSSQLNRPIAIVLDGELISAPIVRSRISGGAWITGGPNGLTPAEVARILESVNQQ